MPESAQKKRNYEINNVLERILDQNPQIVISRIELFTEVYYPIAILEIEMNETTFEDFDLIPLSILRFVDAGVTTAGEIAGLMGLSPGYVQKLLDLLMGYGYLGGNGLTPLGAKSLEMEKKISRNKVRQKFQADALTGDLLHIGQQPMDIDLIGKDRTIRNIAHMPHIEGISMEYLNRQFREGKLTSAEECSFLRLHRRKPALGRGRSQYGRTAAGGGQCPGGWVYYGFFQRLSERNRSGRIECFRRAKAASMYCPGIIKGTENSDFRRQHQRRRYCD